MYQNVILYLYEAQHVSGDTPPISRSLKLHWQPLVFYTWKVVGRVVGGRCRAVLCCWSHFNSNLDVSSHWNRTLRIKIPLESMQRLSSCYHADRQTDRHGEASGRIFITFRCERAKKNFHKNHLKERYKNCKEM
jgi:hypothetical protein